jgi:hypothetical protein
MYFTDRGIEELVQRRGSEEISVEWLGDRLQAFVDSYPEFETAIDRLATWLARVRQRADADRAAEQPTDGQHGQFDAGTHEPDRAAGAPHQSGHEAVPRTGAERGADIHSGRHAAQDDAADHLGDPPHQLRRRGQQRK